MLRRRTGPPANDYFSLSANGGLPREQVLDALRDARFVARAVREGRCFLCRARDIDECGLCLICRSFLTDEEREAARVYYEAF